MSGHGQESLDDQVEPTWLTFSTHVWWLGNWAMDLANNRGRREDVLRWANALSNSYARRRYLELTVEERTEALKNLHAVGNVMSLTPANEPLILPGWQDLFPERESTMTVSVREARAHRLRHQATEHNLATAARAIDSVPTFDGSSFSHSTPALALPHIPVLRSTTHPGVIPSNYHPLPRQESLLRGEPQRLPSQRALPNFRPPSAPETSLELPPAHLRHASCRAPDTNPPPASPSSASSASEEEPEHDEDVAEVSPTWADYDRALLAVVNYGIALPNNHGRSDQIVRWRKSLANLWAQKRYRDLSSSSRQGVIAVVEGVRGILRDTPASEALRLPRLDGVFPPTKARSASDLERRRRNKRKEGERWSPPPTAPEGLVEVAPYDEKPALRHSPHRSFTPSSLPARHERFEEEFPPFPSRFSTLPHTRAPPQPYQQSLPILPSNRTPSPSFAAPSLIPVEHQHSYGIVTSPPSYSSFSPEGFPYQPPPHLFVANQSSHVPVPSTDVYPYPHEQQHGAYPPFYAKQTPWSGEHGDASQGYFSLGRGAVGRRAAQHYVTSRDGAW
ncbi:hypothetical protein JCM10449v2_002282 [Rhodotorula kratochvilovae]